MRRLMIMEVNVGLCCLVSLLLSHGRVLASCFMVEQTEYQCVGGRLESKSPTVVCLAAGWRESADATVETIQLKELRDLETRCFDGKVARSETYLRQRVTERTINDDLTRFKCNPVTNKCEKYPIQFPEEEEDEIKIDLDHPHKIPPSSAETDKPLQIPPPTPASYPSQGLSMPGFQQTPRPSHRPNHTGGDSGGPVKPNIPQIITPTPPRPNPETTKSDQDLPEVNFLD